MAATLQATFAANFAPFDKAVTEAKKNLASLEVSGKGAQAALQRMATGFSGANVIKDAKLMAASIQAVGGVSKLTEAEQRRVNATVSEAVAKYKALGQTAPAELQKLAKETERVEKSSRSWSGVLTGAVAGGVAAITSAALNAAAALGRMAVDGIGELVRRGGEVSAVKSAFVGLAGGVTEADRRITAMRQATRGMLTDFDAMQISNKAMALGLGLNAEQMGAMASSAIVLGRALGQTATKSVDDLVVAMGRQSKMILDNLGIMVDTDKANAEYAKTLGKTADALTDAEKKQAFMNAALASAKELAERAGGVQLTLADNIQRAKNTAQNFFDAVAEGISKSAGLNDIAADIASWLDKAFGADREKLVQAVAEKVNTLAFYLRGAGEAVVKMAGVGMAVFEAFGSTIVGVLRHTLEFELAVGKMGMKLATAAENFRGIVPHAGKAADLLDHYRKMAFSAAWELEVLNKGLYKNNDTVKSSITGWADFAKALFGGGNSVATATDTTKRKLGDFESSMRKAIDAAKSLASEMTKFGSAQVVVGFGTDKIRQVFEDAVTASVALGQKAPAAWSAIAASMTPAIKSLDLYAMAIKELPLQWSDLQREIPKLAGGDNAFAMIFGDNGKIKKAALDFGMTFKNMLKQALGSTNFGASMVQSVVGAFQGGGSAFKSLGASLLGNLGQSVGTAFQGAASAVGGTLAKGFGAVLGPALGPLASLAGGALGGVVDKLFGPSEASKVQKMRDQFLRGVDDLKALEKQAKLAGFEMDRLYNARKVKDFEQAQKDLEESLKNWQRQMKQLESIAGGLEKRFSGFAASLKRELGDAWDVNVTDMTTEQLKRLNMVGEQNKGTFERLGNLVAATFGVAVKHTGDFFGSLQMVAPALEQMIELQGKFGFEASKSAEGLLRIYGITKQFPDLADSISGLTQMIQGFGEAGWMSQGIFSDFATDAKSLFDELITRGVDTKDALLLMQPALQELYEAQKRLGLQLGEDEQKLLDLAQANGLVGESFKSVDEQMLGVLQGIKDVITELKEGLLGIGTIQVPTVRVPYRFEQEGETPEAPGGGGQIIPAFASGSGGIRDFGSGTLAMLHGREAVLTQGQIAGLLRGGPQRSGGGSVVIDARGAFFDAANEQKLAARIKQALAKDLRVVGRAS